MNKDILNKVIFNHQEIFENKEFGLERDCLKEMLPITKNPIAVVITGHRRVGKSVFLQQIAKTYFPKDHYYLDFSDPALKNISEKDYESIYELFLKNFGKKNAFFFDEIQGMPEWNKFVNNLRERGHKCFISGSNAELLSSEISTFLTGRHIDRSIFPFSFKEFLKYKQIDYSVFSTSNTAKILNLFDIYLENGGFPEIVVYNQLDLLKEIYNDIITKDVVVRWNIKDVSEIKDLYYYLLSNATQEYTYISLKSKTNIKDVKTIKKYVDYITKTYMLFEVKQFSYSLQKQRKKLKKIYAIDNGLLSKVGYIFSIGKTRYLENLVFIELKRREKEVYFYRSLKNQECDFLVVENKKVVDAIQVCYTVNDENKEREVNGLLSALREHKLKKGTIITYNTKKREIHDGLVVDYIPAYEWLL